MKRFVLLAAAAVFTAMACTSAPIVFDPALLQEEQTVLYINKGITVTSYNGIPVQWKKMTAIFLPAGNTELVFDVKAKVFVGRRGVLGVVYLDQSGATKYIVAGNDIANLPSDVRSRLTSGDTVTYTFTGTGVPFTYRFEAGKRYNLYFGVVSDQLNSGGICLQEYPADQKRSWLIESGEASTYVPFPKTGQLRWRSGGPFF
ncbi:MAG: hypothetical protein LBQ14_05505 [Treponema sp.]|jgi:hypothetical protein|nr:hypothetical protein [Treponema sp.]